MRNDHVLHQVAAVAPASRTAPMCASAAAGVEDAPAGLEAVRAAGCATIGVEGTHDAADLDADLVVASLDKLRIVVQHDGVKFELLPE
ncbi:hypothetical protein [Cryobacterium algoritolerans]|uniref:hypothetical protein n=1 Tax=Cryobacterium algoritolerans TaxID=1259184 RepID=UPI00157FED51|nr:hypothetical protein [Cryobacterium algoritolerans]